MRKAEILAKALAWMVMSRVMLRSRDTTTTLRRLAGRPDRVPGSPIDPQRAVRAVQIAARIVGGVCLPQAVTLTALLQRGGHEPMLVLGCLRNADGTWSAHAWVDVDGKDFQPVFASGHSALAVLTARSGWIPSQVPDGSQRTRNLP